jgi:hypothetical protein
LSWRRRSSPSSLTLASPWRNAPGQLIDLTEAAPELELVRQGDRFVMRIEPPLRPAKVGDEYLL